MYQYFCIHISPPPPSVSIFVLFTVSPVVCSVPEAFALDRLADLSEGPVGLYFGIELGAALFATMGLYYVLNKVGIFSHQSIDKPRILSEFSLSWVGLCAGYKADLSQHVQQGGEPAWLRTDTSLFLSPCFDPLFSLRRLTVTDVKDKLSQVWPYSALLSRRLSSSIIS